MDQLKTYLIKLKQSVIKDYFMTSREIVIKLIDEKLITGEEAFTLINDILIAEIKSAMETLKESDHSNNLGLKWNGVDWSDYITTTGTATWSGTASAPIYNNTFTIDSSK